ncbi:MAG TPA: VWA domain-containing protein [Ktedonobacterales bacterium]|nr:VWA domain-containing protein [Ktedonobacterales bacterium]
MSTPTATLTEEQRQQLLRWRLVLGSRAQKCQCGAKGGPECSCTGSAMDLGGLAGAGGQDGAISEEDVFGIDGALEMIYQERSAGLGAGNVNIPRWLGDIRRYFPQDVTAMIQKDAIERQGLKELLFEPETLPLLEKNVDLVATIISLQNMIPEQTKETARQVVREIADQIKKKLENEIRQAVFGAISRNTHSPLPVYRNIDWKRTIARNLKNYDGDLKRIIPDRFYFWANEKKFREWQVIVCVDQSGSMASSVVYSSIMAAIFASLSVLRTNLVFFDTQIVDMTEQLTDPVEILFGTQLGGGTDIAKAVTYCAQQVVQPEKTIFLLITDLYEGGNSNVLISQLGALVESKVKALCLLALDDTGRASYDHNMAHRVADLGIPTFACTPNKLIQMMENILQGKEVKA